MSTCAECRWYIADFGGYCSALPPTYPHVTDERPRENENDPYFHRYPQVEAGGGPCMHFKNAPPT